MKNETIKLLKEEMGYTTEPEDKCKDCTHAKEDMNPFEDRSWDTWCHLNPTGKILVRESGRCNYFKLKTDKP